MSEHKVKIWLDGHIVSESYVNLVGDELVGWSTAPGEYNIFFSPPPPEPKRLFGKNKDVQA